MDNHGSIFAGLQACNPRDLCAALADWQHGESADFSLLLGVVRSLALTVDEQRREIAKLNAGLAAVGRVVDDVRGYVELQRASTREFNASRAEGRPFNEERVRAEAREAAPTELGGYPRSLAEWYVHEEPEQTEPSPEGAAWLAQKNRLELVYAGLVDVWRMARPVVNDQREDIGNITRLHERTTALVAIEARCRAMLEAAGKLPPGA